MEQVVPSLGEAVDVSLIDELVMRGRSATLVDAEEVLLSHIWFIWRVAKMLRGKSLPIWIFGVRR